MNREKVNIMREMTIIHENGLKFEKENKFLKESVSQQQKDIELYEN